MNVDEFAGVMDGAQIEFVQDGFYENRYGQIGYRAIYRDSTSIYWYSVSGTDIRIGPDEVAVAICHPERVILREFPYRNRRGQQGFEATVRSGDNSFMLNAAPEPPGQ